jgi:hypothetical protein
MGQGRKNKNFFLILLISIAFITLNQVGPYYINYSILEEDYCLKANLIRFFWPHYYKLTKLNEEKYELLYISDNKNVRSWEINKKDSIQVYYLNPDSEMKAIGNFEFFLKQKNAIIKHIEVGMSIYPDNTSSISITTLRNMELIKEEGLIKVNPFESIKERGKKLIELFLNTDSLNLIKVSLKSHETFSSKSEMKSMVLNEWKL